MNHSPASADPSSTSSVARLRDFFEAAASSHNNNNANKRRGPQTPVDFHQASFFPSTPKLPPPPAAQNASFNRGGGFHPFQARVVDASPPAKQLKTRSSALQRLTVDLPETYAVLSGNNPALFARKPPASDAASGRRILTRDLTKPFLNEGHDNKHNDLIITQGDLLDARFRVLELLGQGTFGQVVKCQANWEGDKPRMVAVKIVKNKPAYHNQAKVEIKVLHRIQDGTVPDVGEHIIQLLDEFVHHNHLCLVFELLSINLYEYIKSNEFRGLPIKLVSSFTMQLLHALDALNQLGIIHCDLKPENILLENFDFNRIKLIDLGSSCYKDSVAFAYIQSRFYRAPEILFGPSKRYTSQIDLWSLGCVVIELFQGLPVFPGCSQHNQVLRMVEMCGLPPAWMLAATQEFETDARRQFFVRNAVTREWRLKSSEEYAMDCALPEVDRTKRYVKERTLEGVIMRCEDKRRPKEERASDLPSQDLESLVDLCQGLLQMDPNLRWTARQAMQHPFVTPGKRYTGPFVPDLEEMEEEEEEEEEALVSSEARSKPMAINMRPLAKRKLSEVGSPFLSSVNQSPIFRPEGVRPLGESWASPRMVLPGSKFAPLPSMLLSSPQQQLQQQEVRRVDFRSRASPPNGSLVAFKPQQQPVMLSSSFQEQPIWGNHNACVEKTLEKWAPFDKEQQQGEEEEQVVVEKKE